MPRILRWIVLSCVVAVHLTTAKVDAQTDTPFESLRSSRQAMMDLEKGWEAPPRIARTRCWWWWLNGNVTKAAISRDLAEMRAKGFGGANIIDAGGAEQRGNRQVPHGPDFASPAWRELFVHALKEADRQGLEMGFNIVSGWNLGGPGVTPEEASKRLTWSETTIDGGRRVSLLLDKPKHLHNFYRDVAVVAIPAGDAGPQPRFRLSASSSQDAFPPGHALDGVVGTFWVSGGAQSGQGPTPERPEWLELRFERPVAADRLILQPRDGYGPRRVRLEATVAGQTRTLAEFSMEAQGRKTVTFDRVPIERLRVVVLDAYDPRSPDRPRNVQIAELALLDGSQPMTHAVTPVARIENFEQKAYYRYPGAFTAPEAWHLLDVGPSKPGEVICRAQDVLDLTANLDAEGRLTWEAPSGTWLVLRFGYTTTGSAVSTHSEGWSGLAIDYLDRGAFETYWKRVVEPILSEAGPYVGRSLKFLHTDSWELGPVNWTARMPQQFRRLRGYELTPYLPCLAGYVVDSREVSTRFLNDFRRTLADLIAEAKYATFAEYAHARDMGIHPESGGPHAGPFDSLRNLGISDIPMGEFWARAQTHRVKDTERLFVKQPACAAHVYGKRLVLAEAFTTIGPQWEQDPCMLKPVFDRVACEGLNLTMWHTFDCSPAEMGIPGQAYFAGTHLNPNVTWWEQSAAFIAYLNRCHFLLQQGLPVADVLYYYGENVPAFVRLKRDDPAGVLPGYDYDVIDTEALLRRVRVDAQGNLVLPDGTSYRLLSLAPYDAISLPTLRHIAALVEGGATLVGPKPKRPYSLSGYPQSDVEFAALADKLWGATEGQTSTENRYGRGRVFSGRSAREVLLADGVGPDFTYAGRSDDTLLDYLHRATDEADIYFVVNRNEREEDVECSFRTTGRQPELWDPVTGERRDAAAFRQTNGRTVVPLRLPANGSLFVLFRRPIPSEAKGPAEHNAAECREVATVSGPWTVKFDPNWGGPASVVFDKLLDWSQHPDEQIRYYAGTAVYETTFDLPEPLRAATPRLLLDLGAVKNVAEVRLNGRDLGVIWTHPFRIDMTDALRPAGNRLEIKVVNLWPNRLIGDARLPPAQRRTSTNITKFKPDSPLLPSGLLGPVRLLTATRPTAGEGSASEPVPRDRRPPISRDGRNGEP